MGVLSRFLSAAAGWFHGSQRGFILQWTIVVMVVGITVAVPVAALVTRQFSAQGRVEDSTRAYYAAEAGILAVAEDLSRGAAAAPRPPYDYIPPTVNVDDLVPAISVEPSSFQVLDAIKPVYYTVEGEPTILVAANVVGDGSDLTEDDENDYTLTSTGDPPSLSYEVTSEVIGLDAVSRGEVQIVAASDDDDYWLELSIYNPDDPTHTSDGYSPTPDGTVTLDDHHDHRAHHDHEGHECDHDHLEHDDDNDGGHDHGFHKFHRGSHDHPDEATTCVRLSDADVDYLNSLSTKTLKVKIKATGVADSESFKLRTDKIGFKMTGSATVDHRHVAGKPTVGAGGTTVLSGSGSDLRLDDTSYLILGGDPQDEVEFFVTSEEFVVSRLDSMRVPVVLRTNATEAILRMWIYNPTKHADGYGATPDLVVSVDLKDQDRWVSLRIPDEDIDYLNTLSPVSVSLKIRIEAKPPVDVGFDLLVEADSLSFVGTTTDSPAQIVRRKVTHQYFDPGVQNPALATVSPRHGYLLRLYSVNPGVMDINWAFSPPVVVETDDDDFPSNPIGMVFRGLVLGASDGLDDEETCMDHADNHEVMIPPGALPSNVSIGDDDDDDNDDDDGGNALIKRAHAQPGDSFVTTGLIEVGPGLYSIVFCNGFDDDDDDDDLVPLTTSPFAPAGNGGDTWIFGPVFKDYAIRSEVGSVDIKAIVRQVPGPTEPPTLPWHPRSISWIDNTVFFEAWEPSIFTLSEEQDLDGDGIHNDIDGVFAGGSFVDQSTGVSASFTDQHLGGKTFGTVEARSGLELFIRDAGDPADGLVVLATGIGSDSARLNVCDTGLVITSGDSLTATCESLTVDTYTGPVAVDVSENVEATVPSFSAAQVTESEPEVFQVANLPDSEESVEIQIENQIEVSLPPATSAQVGETQSEVWTVENTSSGGGIITVKDGAGTDTELAVGQTTQVVVVEPTPTPEATPTLPPA